MNTLGAAAKATRSSSVRALNPALYKAQVELGLSPPPAVARAAVPEALEPEPEPARARTNAWSDGRVWQETVKAAAVLYERDGVLALEKTDPPSRVVGTGAARRVIFVSGRLVDFVGCFTSRGGRMVVLEAKQTQEDRLPLGRPGGVTAAQVATLRAWALAGAMSAVIWRTQSGAWLCTYASLLRAALAGQKSVRPENCVAVPLAGSVRILDGTLVQRPDFAPVLSACYPREAA